MANFPIFHGITLASNSEFTNFVVPVVEQDPIVEQEVIPTPEEEL